MLSAQAVHEMIAQHETEASRLEQELTLKRAAIKTLKAVINADPVASKGPAAAIREMLQQHPSGVSTAELTDALEHVIATTSKNPRRIIQNTVNQMKDAGDVKLSKRDGKTFVKLAGR